MTIHSIKLDPEKVAKREARQIQRRQMTSEQIAAEIRVERQERGRKIADQLFRDLIQGLRELFNLKGAR